jgi:hypothetical protein
MEGAGEKIAKRVLDYDGPLVVTNLLREKFSSSTRPTPAEVRESMESLEAGCLGHVVKEWGNGSVPERSTFQSRGNFGHQTWSFKGRL